MGRGRLAIDARRLLSLLGCPDGTRLAGVRAAPDAGGIELLVQHAALPWCDEGALPAKVGVVTTCEPGGEAETKWSVGE